MATLRVTSIDPLTPEECAVAQVEGWILGAVGLISDDGNFLIRKKSRASEVPTRFPTGLRKIGWETLVLEVISNARNADKMGPSGTACASA